MAMTIEVVYEGGALRPAKPLELPEGCHLEVIVIPKIAARPITTVHSRRVQIIREIVSLPVEGDGESISRHDHDAILYGEPGRQ